jgi:hypothetical protein
LANLVSDMGELAGSKLKLPTDIAMVSQILCGIQRKHNTKDTHNPKWSLIDDESLGFAPRV